MITKFRHTLIASLPLVVAVLLYGYTIHLPLFLDDGPNFWLVENLDGISQWGGTSAFPYYRPVAFSLWKFSDTLFGYHNPVILHWLNIACFGLTGVLIQQLTQRLAGQRLTGLLAGLGFVIFPFSYQGVALVSGLFHITLALGLMFALWAAILWLDGRGGQWILALCWVSAVLGVFSHENGPLLAPLAVGVIWVAYGPRWDEWRRYVLVVGPLAGIAGLYTLLWLIVPRAENSVALSQGVDVALADLLQGLAYPIVAIVARFVAREDVTPLAIIGLVMGAALLGGAVAWWGRGAGEVSPQDWGRSRRLSVLALLWYGLSLLPSVLLLEPAYILGSPRLMLFASIGGSIFWAVILTRYRWTPLLFILLLAVSLSFLWPRRADYIELGRYQWQLFDLIEQQHQPDTRFLIVNGPNYVRSNDETFLLGSEASILMLDVVGYDQQIWLNTGLDYSSLQGRVDALSHGQVIQYQGQNYTPHQAFTEGPPLWERLQAADVVITTYFDGLSFWPVMVRPPNSANSSATPLVSYPTEAITLWAAEATLDDDTLTVSTRWQLTEPLPIKLFIHVVCNGTLITQSDGYVWGNLYPFSQWQADETQSDIRQLRLPNNADPSCLQVLVGLYWEATVTRLEPRDAVTSAAYPDNAIPVIVHNP